MSEIVIGKVYDNTNFALTHKPVVKDITFTECFFTNCDFSYLIFTNVVFAGCWFVECNFTETTFRQVETTDTIFAKCGLAYSYLKSLQTNNTIFSSCDFTKGFGSITSQQGNFAGCNFSDFSFERFMVNETAFINNNFYNASFTKENNLLTNGIIKSGNKWLNDQCPNGAFVGWKIGRGGSLIKLVIPEDAERSSGTANFTCRCNKAFVMEITSTTGEKLQECCSWYDHRVVYRVGEEVQTEMCKDPLLRFSGGIYFFVNKADAIQYRDVVLEGEIDF